MTKIELTARRLRNRLSRTKARIPIVWFCHRGFQSTDIFLGAYPRSGSTWSRFTLFEILTGQEAGFNAVNKTLKGVHRLQHGIPVLPGGGRLLGTHETYRRDYKKAIYLVRDARDVLLSEYAYLKALGYFDGDLDRFILEFSHGNVNGFGPWHRNVSTWLDSPIARTPNLLVVRFEDLRRNPEALFARLTEFLGVPADRQLIHRAVVNNSLDKMREKENQSPQLPLGNDRFVRSGLAQGWRGKLSDSQLKLIEQYAGDVLLRTGYDLSTPLSNLRSLTLAQVDQ
jgi:Sulfotransferase domain